MPTLIIMRGLPGSGKSTLAKRIASSGENIPIFSTDDFFMINGHYAFDPSKLAENHQHNLERTAAAMQAGIHQIIVDNTNTQAWEAREYVRAALRYNYEVRFVEADAPWARDPQECARRNTHGVPLQSIQNMLNRWEDNLTVAVCLAARAPWEQ